MICAATCLSLPSGLQESSTAPVLGQTRAVLFLSQSIPGLVVVWAKTGRRVEAERLFRDAVTS